MKIYSQKTAPVLTEQHFQFDPSFGPYIVTLREKMESSTDIIAKFYRYLIKKFQQHPDLLLPFKNVQILEDHEELIELLRMSLLPLSANTENFPMALAFLQPSCLFYYTSSFKKTFIDEHIEFDTDEDKVSNLRYFIKLVLERCYGMETNESQKIIKNVFNEKTCTWRHYQLNIESRFIHVHCSGKLPEYEEEWGRILFADDEEFLELFSRFPSHRFRLEGFCMFTVEDVTTEVAINQLKNAVLNMHSTELEETLNTVGLAIGELLNNARIRIGITPFLKINDRLVYDSSFIAKGVCISSNEKNASGEFRVDDLYQRFLASPQPLLFKAINKAAVSERPYLHTLLDQNIRSFMVYPIVTMDGLMGVFELGFEEENEVSRKTIELLQPAFSLITDLIYYMIDIFDNKIDRVVKEKFTPLQRSVEWKFNEVAWQFLLYEGDDKEDESIGSVVFRQVFPLFGAVDIRESSVKRNLAVRNDFLYQLNETKGLIVKTENSISLPLLNSMSFKCDKFINAIQDVLTSEDEIKISEFFDIEVISFLKSLAFRYPEYEYEVVEYLKKTDMDFGEFHQNRREYESSFQKINKSIVSYFEQEVEKLQSVYPFYFEKFRTDGVEYNIYIGQAIAPTQQFDPIYLKNLRLWQLTSMAHIALLNHNLLDSLPVPLQTTQLILVHSLPIDISFRKDERRFDVEGSYNIRYEMLKKRIDKVRIKDSLERLTQPGKIAIVYANTPEVQEYIQHIEFLQGKGLLTEPVENYELEDLQGVAGLKALRVGVDVNRLL